MDTAEFITLCDGIPAEVQQERPHRREKRRDGYLLHIILSYIEEWKDLRNYENTDS